MSVDLCVNFNTFCLNCCLKSKICRLIEILKLIFQLTLNSKPINNMKAFFSITLLFISILSFAQEDGTTLEEYRYLSKGYVYQLEMGLDAQKEGYSVKKLYTSSNKSELVALYKNGTAQPRALLVILDTEKTKPIYICIPNGLAENNVKELAELDQKNIPVKTKNKYQAAMNEFLFEALSSEKPDLIAFQMKKSPPPLQKMQDKQMVSRSANLTEVKNEGPEIETLETPVEPMVIEEPAFSKTSSMEVSGDVYNREVVSAEEAVINSRKKGVVAIKICVNKEGTVSTAKFTQRGSTTFDSYLKDTALKAAKSIKFAPSELLEQCGIVTYKF